MKKWTTYQIIAAVCSTGVIGAISPSLTLADLTDQVSHISSREVFPQPSAKMTSDYFHLVQKLSSVTKEERVRLQKSTHDERALPIFVARGENHDEVETYISVEYFSPLLTKQLEKLGVEIIATEERSYLIQAWVPLSSVEQVVALDGVRTLRRPSYAIPATGSVLTEGETNLQTNFIRNYGNINGNGIRVGVISQGLFGSGFSASFAQTEGSNNDPRVASGNLPIDEFSENGASSGSLGAVTIRPTSFLFHEIDGEGDPRFFPEGAAMLEIVHDIAPGASLYFYDPTALQSQAATSVLMNQARQYLLSQGVEVIVDDLVFYDAGRFDGSSTVSRRAQEIVLNENVVYVTASGNQTPPELNLNDGSTAVETKRFPIFVNGFFSPSPGFGDSKFHNWAYASSFTETSSQLFIRPQNNIIEVTIVWDDIWDEGDPRAVDDLDLFLFKPENLSPGDDIFDDVVAFSSDIQGGTGLPIEKFTAFIPPGYNNALFRLVLSRKDSSNSAPVLFTAIITQGIVDASSVDFLTHGIAGNNGDAPPPVISVGAIDASLGVDTIDGSTVPGLTPGPGRANESDFVKWYTEQESPAVVSYSSVSTQSTGTFGFTGSSAAAAHIGGFITLLRHSFRDIPSYDYYDILQITDAVPNSVFPNATLIEEDTLSVFKNVPKYFRVNGLDTWLNLTNSGGKLERTLRLSTTAIDGETWTESGEISPFNPAVFDQSEMGIEIGPGGQDNVFGFWQTEVLGFGAEGETKTLDATKLYELSVRVGTDEKDPTRVPDFRLRLTTGGNDESALLVVAGLDGEASNAPSTIGGKTYKLYYQPSNQAIAEQGVRFAFDLLHFDASDNADATFYIQELSLSELSAP